MMLIGQTPGYGGITVRMIIMIGSNNILRQSYAGCNGECRISGIADRDTIIGHIGINIVIIINIII
jgi:hypothetical protein